LRALQQRIDAEPEPGEIRAAGTELAAMLAQYKTARDQISDGEAADVQKIVAMLHQTVAVLSAGSQRSVARLRQIEDDLKQTAAISDIVALKARLGDAMRYVREQGAQEREESARVLVEIEREVQQAQESMAVARSGMGGRAEAERSLAEAMPRRPRTAAAVFLLESVANVKQRFGAALGERFFSLFVQDLAGALPAPRKLFRWSETAVLAELETDGPAAALRSQIPLWLASIPAQRRLDVGQRLAVLSNGHRWTLIPLADVGSAADAIRRVEAFLRA
jgi:hypothetical protein